MIRLKPLALALIAVFVAATFAYSGAQEPSPVPISEEHHHHLIIENSYIKAYEVEVPAHEITLLHQHDYDYVYMVFGDADVTNAVLGKPEVKLHLDDTTVNFSRGPFAHIAGNVGNTPFRNVTVSLLRPQVELKTYFPNAIVALRSSRRIGSGGGPITILETNEILVQTMEMGAGSEWNLTPIDHPRLMIVFDKLFDATLPREKNAPTFPAGMLKWISPSEEYTLGSPSSPRMRYVWLEFKD